jgi:hypothetical protein
MTFNEILKVPPGRKVSVYRALAALDIIRSSAESKAEVLTDTLPTNDHDPIHANNVLMANWFTSIAESASRQIDDLNSSST